MTANDDVLASEMISLLRDIRAGQQQHDQKNAALERAMLGLNQNFASLDKRRFTALAIAAWGLAASILVSGGLIAAAITWGI